MRNSSWNDLVALIDDKRLNYQLVGFIIDSSWIPSWYGISNIQYYTSDEHWWKSNLKAVSSFSDVWFMPGFWSEYGMCTEPSAFGARIIWLGESLLHREKITRSIKEVNSLPDPNVKTDGLLPFIISRSRNNEEAIKRADHQIRFTVARGPLNIASFLMGTTGLMMSLALNPEGAHKLLNKITVFLYDWLTWHKEDFPSIDGVLILDDIIGFIKKSEFREFVIPYFGKIFDRINVKVRFLYNDAEGSSRARFLEKMGVNMFNFSFEHSLGKIRELAGDNIFLVTNIPPRDVLAAGTPEQVTAAVKKAKDEINDHARNMVMWRRNAYWCNKYKYRGIY